MTTDHKIFKTAELSAEARRLRSEHSRRGGRHMRWPADFRRAVMSLLSEGLSVPEMAQALGMSQSTIYTWQLGDERDKADGKGSVFSPLLVVPDKRVGGEKGDHLMLRTRGGHEVMLKMSELASLFESEVL